MNWAEAFREALASLHAHRLRAILTMLGMVIGVACVIVMLALVDGAKREVLREFQRLGSSLIFIWTQPESLDRRKAPRTVEPLTLADADEIRRRCSLVSGVAPVLDLPAARVEYQGNTIRTWLLGVDETFAQVREVRLAQGRFLLPHDLNQFKKVCVLGYGPYRRLFKGETAVGKEVSIEGMVFTIVGVVARRGLFLGMEDVDNRAYIPLTAMYRRLTGEEQVGVIFAQAAQPARAEEAADQVWVVLMARHHNHPDYTVDTQSRLLESVVRVGAIFKVALGGIGGVSLLVGGIGIMNIMLVSVTERTREIGLRKAVGARRRDVLHQFVLEAIALSACGGTLGILLGAALTAAISALGKQWLPAYVSLWAVLLGFLFSVAVGLFFGIYPARRAARMDPIEALRHE